MRKGIHPEYNEATVICSCGNKFQTRSTEKELHVELCSACHPFYTGQQKFVDTGGRVQRFSDKFGGAAAAVMEKEQAERDARQKAHEDTVIAAREAKAARDAAEAAEAARIAKEAEKAEAKKRKRAEEAGETVEPQAAAEDAVAEAPAEDVVAEAPAEVAVAEAEPVAEPAEEAAADESEGEA